MAIAVTQHLDRELTVVAWHGPVGLKALLDTVTKVRTLGHTRFSLWDFSSATAIDLTLAEVQRLVMATRNSREAVTRAKTAIVAPTSLLYGLGRQAQSLAALATETRTIEIFRERAAALAWVGVADDGV